MKIKKLLSYIVLLTFFFNIIVLPTWADDLAVGRGNLLINGYGSPISIKPGDKFTLDIGLENITGDDLQKPEIKVTFDNKGDSFQYLGGGFLEYIQPIGVDTFSSAGFNIPSAYSIDFSTGSILTLYAPNIIAKEDINVPVVTINAYDASNSLYIDVLPHLIDYYFTNLNGDIIVQTNGYDVDKFNLVAKIQDWNGCSNISSGNVSADLSAIGLGSNETLVFQSCDTNTKTATYMLSEITSPNEEGLVSMPSSIFSFNDEFGHPISNSSNDEHFFQKEGNGDRVSPLELNLTMPEPPVVINKGMTDNAIGGPLIPSTNISFSVNHPGDYRVVLGTSCSEGTEIRPYTPYLNADEEVQIEISGADLPQEGLNQITICVKDSADQIGMSAPYDLIKDTTAPIIDKFLLTYKYEVYQEDAYLKFQCPEDGYYKVMVEGTDAGTAPIVATNPEYSETRARTEVFFVLKNEVFENYANQVTLYCRDIVGNEASYSDIYIDKIPTPPTMKGSEVKFEDTDIDYEGLDGRDIYISWDSSLGDVEFFGEYLLYVLPAGTPFNSETHTPIARINDKTISEFTGDSSITNDSLGNALVTNNSYKVYVLIYSIEGKYGEAGESPSAMLIADTPLHASVEGARFIAHDRLEITSDVTLDTATGSHDISKISYKLNGSDEVFNPISIVSINDKTIVLEIPSFGSSVTDMTGNSLIIEAEGLHSLLGGFNDEISFSSVTDAINPVLSDLKINTTPLYNDFWKGQVVFSWNLSEDMDASVSNLTFKRIGGETSSDVTITLLAGDILKGTNTKDIDTFIAGFVCGAKYEVLFTGKDLASNELISDLKIASFIYDNCGPTAPTIQEFSVSDTDDTIFSWATSVDDNSNGSGVKEYRVEIFSSNDCATGSLVTSEASTSLNKTINLSNASYSWRVLALDNLSNEGAYSICSSFVVDNTIPTISELVLEDNNNLTGTGYLIPNSPIEISANITNTDADNIVIDLSQIFGNDYVAVKCSSSEHPLVTCSYVSGELKYNFTTPSLISEGAKEITLTINNAAGVNEVTDSIDIIIDNANPTIESDTLLTPMPGTTIGSKNNPYEITWNTNKITDSIGVKEVEISYIKGDGTPTIIYSGDNSGTYEWDLSQIPSGNDYKLQIVVRDNVGNEDTLTSSQFNIDTLGPEIDENTISLVPNLNQVIKGGNGSTFEILWNSGSITDNFSFRNNPIRLEYSTGTTVDENLEFFLIEDNLSNSGTYTWTTPNIQENSVRIRLTAIDEVGNETYIIGDSFYIDNLAPLVTITTAETGNFTPPNNRYLNNSGFNISFTSSDMFMKEIKYVFKRLSDGKYFNGSDYFLEVSEIVICSDGTTLGTNNACDDYSSSVNPIITESNIGYELYILAEDEAGFRTQSDTLTYTSDMDEPEVTISNLSGSFIRDTLTLTGSSSDLLSGVSAVNIQVIKDSKYLDNTGIFVDNPYSFTTSGALDDWTFELSVPEDDISGTEYEIKAIAYDSAYRVNNSGSTSITLIRDKDGPNITPNIIITPSDDEIVAGGDGEEYMITWDTTSVSDDYSGVDEASIKLEYQVNGGDFILIGENISNSGAYLWQSLLSDVDSDMTRIKFTISDNSGNSSYILSDTFTLDTVPPTVKSIETKEYNIANGNINALRLTLSEKIDENNINLTDFTISDGIGNPSSFFYNLNNNDEGVLTLIFDEIIGTASTPTLSYSGGSIKDLSGKELVNFSQISIDKVGPRVLKVEGFDRNENGKLDELVATFSEDIANTNSALGLSLGNNIDDQMTINSTSVVNNELRISLNEGEDYSTNTGILRLLLSQTEGSEEFLDLGNNIVGDFDKEIEDKASPTIIGATTRDMDNNGRLDNLLLSFSERFEGFDLSQITIYDESNTPLSLTNFTQNEKQISIDIEEILSGYNTDAIVRLDFDGTGLVDSASNSVISSTQFESVDGISPIVVNRTTRDSDTNGRIDGIEIEFSEELNNDISTLGVQVGSTTYNNIESIDNNKILVHTIERQDTLDTGDTPEIRIISNTSLSDTNNNVVLLEGLGTNATDGVGPIIAYAVYEEIGNGIIYLTLSEDIDTDRLGTIASDIFGITGNLSLGTNPTITLDPDEKNKLIINMGDSAGIVNINSHMIGAIANKIYDASGNGSPGRNTNNLARFSGGIVISEVLYYDDNNQYIELRNLTSQTLSLSGYILLNAGGINPDTNAYRMVALDTAGTIEPYGYYLISRTAGTNVNSIFDASVTPNEVKPGLNVFDAKTISLNNGTIIVDRVNIEAWSSPESKIAKERNTIPGDGNINSNWHDAAISSGFKDTTIKGTPNASNTLDDKAPEIIYVYPADLQINPISPTLIYAYSDEGTGIDTNRVELKLYKYNNGVYEDITSEITNSKIEEGISQFNTNPLDYGRYKAELVISDKGGNKQTNISEFYIDDFSVSINAYSSNMGILGESGISWGDTETIITIKSVGAIGEVLGKKNSLLSEGDNKYIHDWDNTLQSGFGIDISKNENGVFSPYSNGLTKFDETVLNSSMGVTATDGSLKTYTYKVKYGGKIDSSVAAGAYNTIGEYTITPKY